MDYDGHFTRLSGDECRQLLRARTVGRVAWMSADGLQILPVNYAVADDLISFVVDAGTVMGELIEPTAVAFEVDDVDEETATGWSVLVRGLSVGYLSAQPDRVRIPVPWAPGEHSLVVVLTPSQYTGRAVSAGTESEETR